MVVVVCSAARELEARIVTMEEDLQSGCEECLAAAQDTLRCISSLLEPDKDKQGAESGLDEGAGSKGQQPGLLQAGRDGVKGLGAEHMCEWGCGGGGAGWCRRVAAQVGHGSLVWAGWGATHGPCCPLAWTL